MEKSTALVTGASGFVGSHLVDLLLEKNYNVRILTRKGSELRWLKGKQFEVFDCGFNDIEQLKNVVKGVDYCFHVAGVIKAKKKETFYNGNVTATKNLLTAFAENNKNLKRFVFVGSQAGVGPSPSKDPIDETYACKPLTEYGRTKHLAEIEVLKMKDQLPITICRPPVVYGPRDPEICLFFQTIKKGLHPLIGFDEKYVSIVNVFDLIKGIVQAGESDKSLGKTYFLSSDYYYGWTELGSLSSKLLNVKTIKLKIPHFVIYTVAGISQFLSYFKKSATILNIEKANEMVQKYWICSNQNAKKDFGFNPTIGIEEGFTETIKWYREIGWL